MTCGKKTSDQMIDKPAEPATAKLVEAIVINDQDCFPERKVVSTMTAQEVSIIKKGDKFFCAYENTHLEVCELPNQFQQEGMTCKIDGEVLEIYPNERRMGTPFRLQKIY
jgi:hypothetical protein